MAVPSTFADLSTTPASNSGLISDASAVNVIDDHARTIYALIASISANSGNGWTSPYLPAANPVYTGTLTGGTGVVDLGSGQFYKAAGGDVGIGTTTPGAQLSVVNATSPAIHLRRDSSNEWYFAATATGADALAIRSGGNLPANTQVTVLAGGFVGLGTTTPGAILHTVKTSAGNPTVCAFIQNSDNTVGTEVRLGFAANSNVLSADRYSWIGSVNTGGTNGGALRFATTPGGTAATERMRIDGDGNVGVGTTSPGAKFELAGASNATEIRLRSTDTTPANIRAYVNAVEVGKLSFLTGNNLSVETGGTERMRITSGGTLVVGHTAAAAFEVFCASNANAATAPMSSWNRTTTGDSFFAGWYTETTATLRGSIDYNRAGGLVRYNTTSDYRAKDIIGPVQDPGATIDALQVYEGQMKGATQSRPMLVAHEAQEHAPYAVSGVKDEVNEDGTPKFQQIDVSSLVPLLIAEIQSLRARVAALES